MSTSVLPPPKRQKAPLDPKAVEELMTWLGYPPGSPLTATPLDPVKGPDPVLMCVGDPEYSKAWTVFTYDEKYQCWVNTTDGTRFFAEQSCYDSYKRTQHKFKSFSHQNEKP